MTVPHRVPATATLTLLRIFSSLNRDSADERSTCTDGSCLLGVGVDGPRRHRLCQDEVVADLKQRGPSVEQISRIGMDTSKHFFQLHGGNAAEKAVLRKKLRSKERIVFCEALATSVHRILGR